MAAGEAEDAVPQPAAYELSPNAGEGETSMSTLIQKQLTNILAPLAERVMDLEEKGRRDDATLVNAKERLEDTDNRLDANDRRMAGMRDELGRTNHQLMQATEGLGDHGERCGTLEKDHEITRNLANRLDSGHKDSSNSIVELQRVSTDLDNRVRELQRAVSETNIAHLNINDRMTEARNRHECLHDRHQDLVKSVQEVKQADENTRQGLKRFTALLDKQRKDDQRAMGNSDDRLKNAEEGLAEVQYHEDQSTKALKLLKKEVERLRAILDDLAGHDQRDRANTGHLADIPPRLKKVEDVLFNMNSTSAKGADVKGVAGMFDVQQLRDAVAKNAADLVRAGQNVDNLGKTVAGTVNRVQVAEQQVTDAVSKADRLKEQLDKSDQDLRMLVVNTQRDATSKIDSQAYELAKTNTALLQEKQRLDAASAGLQKLDNELGSTNGRLDKVAGSSDLAHEYFNGLSKGLQDTHKRVLSGQDGMLAPKSAGPAGRRPLPLISGTTPRPGSAARYAGTA